MDTLYWEEYAGQPTDGFVLISAEDEEKVNLTDIDAQVAEYRRRLGKDCTIYIYKEK